ncbi:acyltransferase family protein [Actinoplanes friuliensis]|uniref:Acyltransferase 3 n=1 Tax=Actinoplanes friuliensis DSM 7358 TaxID=1246995 RepID=U5W614_9ACTN|nr:acyltransferase [Actinoplanes friuliensis]AGZ43391.1 acyltransferase 3 [Actinoplanes friuliensis DSM 7358]
MRNRYLDLLRAAAIVRVIVYHLFGWPWLSILLPAMGIMFALAGSLTAASLDKRSAGSVITSRLRRLLPPLWLLAAIAVPAMLYLGWTDEDGGDKPLSWKLALWILPVGDPPGSERGIDVWEPLWYIRAYLWFVVLSPLLYLAYKKIGWVAVAAPIILIAVLDKTDLTLPFGRADAAMWDFATYGACWIAGFAHHDGRLARLHPRIVLAAATVIGCAALYWLRGHPGEDGYDLNDVSESQALWSLAFVLLALRWQPDMSWLSRNRLADGAVNFLNARAVTIYLWHNIAIAAIWPVLTFLALDDLDILDGPVDLAASLALTLLAVVAFGWVEDVAARRRPRLWPAGAGRGPTSGKPGDGGLPPGPSAPGPSAPGPSAPGPSALDPSVPDPSAPGRPTAGLGGAGFGGAGTDRVTVAFGEPGSPAPDLGRGPSGPPAVSFGGPVGGVTEPVPADEMVRRSSRRIEGFADDDRVAPWAGPDRKSYGPDGQVVPFPEAEVSFGLPAHTDGPTPDQEQDEATATAAWFGRKAEERP